MLSSRNTYLILLLTALGMGACQKQQITTPAFSEFTATVRSNKGSYFIPDDPASVFKIPVGISVPSNKDRVITFSVSSPSGALPNKQYSLQDSTSITIPAGTVIDSIPVKGIYAGYSDGHTDTLVFTLTGGDVSVSPVSAATRYTLTMQHYCQVILSDLQGQYNNCYDLQAGSPPSGPYPISFPQVVSTGATTATATMVDLWGVGTSLTLNLDWTDPGNFKTIVPQQILYVDPTYGPITISPAGTGTFSSCNDTFTISYSISAAAGSFGDFITTIAL